jgi:hypothetical protein
VLRPLSSVGEDLFELVGETYLHGVMHGEIFGMEDLEFREVRLQ